jgi:hypothetical protein
MQCTCTKAHRSECLKVHQCRKLPVFEVAEPRGQGRINNGVDNETGDGHTLNLNEYELFGRGHGPSKLRSMLLVMVICNLV